MPNTIQLPKTIKEATKTLGSLEGLITAKQWERAAIVYAFTYDTGGGRPAQSAKNLALLTLLGLGGK